MNNITSPEIWDVYIGTLKMKIHSTKQAKAGYFFNFLGLSITHHIFATS